MPLFYTFHHLIHYTLDLKNKSDGQKNCITLLLGTVAWVLLWVFLYTFKNTFYYEALRTGFIVILLADIVTMAYLYKSYYGRFITNELGEDPSTTAWKFDDKTKKYKRKDTYDLRIDNYEKRREFNKYLDKLDEENKKINVQKQTQAIIDQKNRLRATLKIQDWYRQQLYQRVTTSNKPKTSKYYKEARSHFTTTSDQGGSD